jgi:SAM-dependent methyltransferase
VLELGGGTGEDAIFLAQHGRNVLLTDGAPAMIARAQEKIRAAELGDRVHAQQIAIEELGLLNGATFAGAYSNFAAFNCVTDRRTAARRLGALLPPGAPLVLVVFGTCSIGEIGVQLFKGDVRAAFRRFTRGPVPARLGGQTFTVDYPTVRMLAGDFAPFFSLERVRGIGVFVPPSAAEPVISDYPRVVRVLEALDRVASMPLARLGDHVLLRFERTSVA